MKKRVEDAITDALRELLRPVFVRDCACNILGRVADKDVANEVHWSDYAGYGMPKVELDRRMRKAKLVEERRRVG